MTVSPAARDPGSVPFLDLEPTLAGGIREGILSEVAQLFETHAYTNGPAVARFEDAFARYVGTRACVGVASELDALRLALLARGVGPGEEVIVPANTFVATLEAVSQTGARPVPVDVREQDFTARLCRASGTSCSRQCPRTRAMLGISTSSEARRATLSPRTCESVGSARGCTARSPLTSPRRTPISATGPDPFQ
jgi:hypothetical protein